MAIRSLTCGLLLSCFAANLRADDEMPGRRVALLVGINAYQKPFFDNLKYAERDVEQVAAELTALGFEVTTLKGQQATRQAIDDTARRLVTPLAKDDLMLVMLCGHGVQADVPQPGGASKNDAFFCPYDAVANDPATLFSLSRLIDEILAPNVGRKLVLVDACRSDPDPARSSRGIEGKVIALPEDTAVMFACRKGQKSFENDELQHGLFTWCVLEALRGDAARDGEIAWSAVVDHVNRRMASAAFRTYLPGGGARQEPIPAGGVSYTVLGRLAATVKPVVPTPSPTRPAMPAAPAVVSLPPQAALLFIQATALANTAAEPALKDSCLSWVAIHQASCGDFAGATQTIDTIVAEGQKVTAWRTLARSHAEYGDVATARQVCLLMRDPDDQASTLRNIADVQFKAGDLTGARETFDLSEQAMARIPPEDEIDVAYARMNLAEGLARVGDFEAAELMARSIASFALHARALAQVAAALAEAGQTKRADLAFADARLFLERITDVQERGDVLGELAAARHRAGDRDGARGLIAQLVQLESSLPEGYEKSSLSGDVADALARTGDFTGALAAADRTSDSFDASLTRMSIAIEQNKAGHGDGGVSAAAAIGDVWMRTSALEGLTQMQRERLPAAALRAALQEAWQATLQSDRMQGLSLANLAEAFARSGDVATGLQIAESIAEVEGQVRALAAVAAVMTKTALASPTK